LLKKRIVELFKWQLELYEMNLNVSTIFKISATWTINILNIKGVLVFKKPHVTFGLLERKS